MKNNLYPFFIVLCLLAFCACVISNTTTERENTLKQTLAYLNEIPEVARIRFDRNTVIIGVDRVPYDIQSIAQAAAFHGNRAIDFGVHVWVVPASSTCGAFKNYYGMTTARHGKIEKPFGK